MKPIKFTKMVASGNDFVLIDGKDISVQGRSVRLDETARRVCNRKLGIGADGMLVLEKSRKANFRMRIFNPDGSEPAMCGNGARCIAVFSGRKKVRFETKAGIIEAEVYDEDRARIKMTDPTDIWKDIDLNLGSNFIKVHYINTGVPHTIFFVSNINTLNIIETGRGIRYHKQFQPEGTNVDFVQFLDKNKISIRTYERGVEAETLACGTGAVASAIIGSYLGRLTTSPVLVHTRSNDVLKVYFENKRGNYTNVWLEGSVTRICDGRFYL